VKRNLSEIGNEIPETPGVIRNDTMPGVFYADIKRPEVIGLVKSRLKQWLPA
jgi:hypothetical protein